MGQQLVFAHDGRPFLSYESRAWLLGPDGEVLRPAAREVGFWRPQPDGELEVLLTHATGITEIYYGRARNLTSWEITTDAVVRTESAKDVVGGAPALRPRRGRRPGLRGRTGDGGPAAAAAPLGPAQPDRRLSRRHRAAELARCLRPRLVRPRCRPLRSPLAVSLRSGSGARRPAGCPPRHRRASIVGPASAGPPGRDGRWPGGTPFRCARPALRPVTGERRRRWVQRRGEVAAVGGRTRLRPIGRLPGPGRPGSAAGRPGRRAAAARSGCGRSVRRRASADPPPEPAGGGPGARRPRSASAVAGPQSEPAVRRAAGGPPGAPGGAAAGRGRGAGGPKRGGSPGRVGSPRRRAGRPGMRRLPRAQRLPRDGGDSPGRTGSPGRPGSPA